MNVPIECSRVGLKYWTGTVLDMVRLLRFQTGTPTCLMRLYESRPGDVILLVCMYIKPMSYTVLVCIST